MRIRDDIPEQIKRRLTIMQIIEHYGFKVNHAGFIACPFHDEKTPSLKIYPETNSYYCFGCGTGGDIINFIMHLFHLDFGSALIRIDNDFRMNLLRPATARERIEAKKQAKELEQKQIDDKILKYAYHLHYNAVIALFRQSWSSYLSKRPKAQNEELNPVFIKALHTIDFYEYWLETYKTFEKWKEVYG